MSCTNTAEPIEMPFEMLIGWGWVRGAIQEADAQCFSRSRHTKEDPKRMRRTIETANFSNSGIMLKLEASGVTGVRGL